MAAQQKLPISLTTLDVDTDESVQAGIAAIQTQHGAVDVLVNNAGIECFGSIEELSIEDFRSVMEPTTLGCCAALSLSCRRCASAGMERSSMPAQWRERSATRQRHRVPPQNGRWRH
jgi:NAD(P)-dependent dehydrogenase (short-subunit alcohol dehydrogenase family)